MTTNENRSRIIPGLILTATLALASLAFPVAADELGLCRFMPLGVQNAGPADPERPFREIESESCKERLVADHIVEGDAPVQRDNFDLVITMRGADGKSRKQHKLEFNREGGRTVDIGERGFFKPIEKTEAGDNAVDFGILHYLQYPYEVKIRGEFRTSVILGQAVSEKIRSEAIERRSLEMADATELFPHDRDLEREIANPIFKEIVIQGSMSELRPDGVSLLRVKVPMEGTVLCMAGDDMSQGVCKAISRTARIDGQHYALGYYAPAKSVPSKFIEGWPDEMTGAPDTENQPSIKLLYVASDGSMLIGEVEGVADGYWPWLKLYVGNWMEFQEDVDAARLALSVKARETARKRARWLKYFQAEYGADVLPEMDYGVLDYFGELLGLSLYKAGGSAPETTSYWGGGAGRFLRNQSTATDRSSPSATRAFVQLGQWAKYSARKNRDKLKAEIDVIKAEQRQIIDEVLSDIDELLSSLDEQIIKLPLRRKSLDEEKQSLEALRELIEIELYFAAEWYRDDELPRLIDALDLDKVTRQEEILMWSAKRNLAQAGNQKHKVWFQSVRSEGGRVSADLMNKIRAYKLQALNDLRRLVELKPANDRAREMLKAEELYWLRLSAAKVSRERRASFEAFMNYLKVRGIAVEAGPEGWPSFASEYISAAWGMGPIALFGASNRFNVPAYLEYEVSVNQFEAARYELALWAMVRLVKNGVTLTKIPRLTTDEFIENLVFQDGDGQELAYNRARVLLRDVRRTAKELPDLRALTSGNPEELVDDVNGAFAHQYFDAIDSEYHWWELAGDVFNGHMIVTFWSFGSITGPEKWRKFLWPSEVAAARAAGQTVGHGFYTGFRLNKLVGALGKTTPGRWIRVRHRLDRYLLARSGRLAREAWQNGKYWAAADAAVNYAALTTGELAATFGLMFSTYTLAHASGYPQLVLLVEMIDGVASHAQFSKFATRTGTPLKRLLTQVDDLAATVKVEKQSVGWIRKTLRRLVEGADPDTVLSSSMRTAGDDVAAAATSGRSLAPSSALPHSDHAALNHALSETADAARRGDLDEVRRIGEFGEDIAGKVENGLDDLQAKIARARERVVQAIEAPPAKAEVFPQPKKISELDHRASSDFFPKNILDSADNATELAATRGNTSLIDDNLDDALDHFSKARKLAGDSNDVSDFLDNRIAFVVNAKAARHEYQALRAASPPLTAKDPIGLEEFERVVDLVRVGKYEKFGSGTSELFLVKGDGEMPDLLFKRYNAGQHKNIMDRAKVEAFGASVMNALGLNAPASRVIALADGTFGLIVRPIPGKNLKSLNDLPEHVILALRKEYAQQRAVRAALGDPDGHFGNVLVDDFGNVWNIDFDRASLDGSTLQFLGYDFKKPEALVEAIIRFSHGTVENVDPGLTLFAQAENAAGNWIPQRMLEVIKGKTSYKWMKRADQMARLEDMAAPISALEDMFEGVTANAPLSGQSALIDRLRSELATAELPAENVDTFFRTLGDRVKILRESLGDEALFGSGPLSSLLDEKTPQFAWLPQKQAPMELFEWPHLLAAA